MWTAQSDSRVFGTVLALLTLLAWSVLAAWGFSPYAKWLGHEALASPEIRLGGSYLLAAAAFVTGWTLMTIAMMLPTSIPLVLLFKRFTSQRKHRWSLLALLLLGYLGIWTLFGVGAHFGDYWLHRLVESNTVLGGAPWLLAAAPLILAGIYQFTPLKYLCLDKCRSPYSFILGHWHGRSDWRESLVLGVRHGLFCIGCCWALMLLMFAVGVGSLGWMLVLAMVMAIEKNVSWGKRLSLPLGTFLLVSGTVQIILGLHPVF